MSIVRDKYESLREDYNNPLATNKLADLTIIQVIGDSESVKEKVKHHSMVLFGLACDISACVERCLDYEKELLNLKAKYKALRLRYVSLNAKYSRRCQRIKELNAELKKS